MNRKPQRPASVTVFSIFQIIFGLISLCGAGFGFYILSGGMNTTTPIQQTTTVNTPTGPTTTTTTINLNLQQELDTRVPTYRAFGWSSSIFGLLLALMMLASGIGMLALQSWARMMALIWALLYLLQSIVSLVYVLIFMIPAYNAIADQWDKLPVPGPLLATTTRWSGYTTLGGMVLYMIYPSLLLFFMTRPKVRDAFAGIDRRRDDDYDDRDRDRYDDRDRDRYDDRDRDRDRYESRDRDRYDRDRDRDDDDDRDRDRGARERDPDDRIR
jgi:uncharacterized membrane protein